MVEPATNWSNGAILTLLQIIKLITVFPTYHIITDTAWTTNMANCNLYLFQKKLIRYYESKIRDVRTIEPVHLHLRTMELLYSTIRKVITDDTDITDYASNYTHTMIASVCKCQIEAATSICVAVHKLIKVERIRGHQGMLDSRQNKYNNPLPFTDLEIIAVRTYLGTNKESYIHLLLNTLWTMMVDLIRLEDMMAGKEACVWEFITYIFTADWLRLLFISYIIT